MFTSLRIAVAKRKTLFDDRPTEINELTYVIKQDLSSLNSQISSLQSLSKSQQSQSSRGGAEQEGEHNKNVSRYPKPLKSHTHQTSGRCPPPRQTRLSRHKLQRSPRSPHQKPASLQIPHRKLRLLRLCTFPTAAQPATVRLPALQHSHKITHTAARLSELKSRHIKPRSVIVILGADAEWPAVGSATHDDGGGAAAEFVYQYAGGGYRYDRADDQ